MTQDQEPKCKGFWKMCTCDKCMRAERALEVQISEDKRKALTECALHHAVKIDLGAKP